MSILTQIRIPMTFRHVEGRNVGDQWGTWPIRINPDLEVRGWVQYPNYGPCYIELREWDEQVLLHEVMHVVLDSVLAGHGDFDDHHHKVINRVEVAVIALQEQLLAVLTEARQTAPARAALTEGGEPK